ncbi:MAG: cytochrome-c peroxidase [Flavobacteriales bacterium]|nr:cytochrome-c peroxidase [Flavobacteriales bacterium]
MLVLVACQPETVEPEPPGTSGPTPYDLQLPANLPPMSIPMDNPLTVEGVALGRFLFFEERLSGNNTMSCATCHGQLFGFTDNGHAVSTGIDGIAGDRNSMPLFNLGWSSTFFWDGRSPTLEKQILEPVPNPIEMHETWPNAVAKLAADPAYPPLFRAAFGSSVVDSVRVAKAMAQFIRTMVSANSKFDRVLRGQDAFTLEEQMGFELFNKEGGPPGVPIPMPGGGFILGQGGGDCFHCHPSAGGLFTDFQFRNNGLDATFTDLGRGGVTGDPQDMGKFKTPSLRNIAVTQPYMHDGRFATLEDVIEHYNSGGVSSPTVDPFMKFTDPGQTLELTPEKKQQILAFLNTLTDLDFLNDPRFSDPGAP